MSFARYFRLVLFLPLVIGALATLFPEYSLMTALAVSTAIAGIPYIVFSLVVMIWSRGRSARALILASFVLPILFTPVFLTFVLLGDVIPIRSGDLMSSFGSLAPVILVVGYSYVILGWIGYVALLWIQRMLGHGA